MNPGNLLNNNNNMNTGNLLNNINPIPNQNIDVNPPMNAYNNYNNQGNTNYNPVALNSNRQNTAPIYNPIGSNLRLTTQIYNSGTGYYNQITGCTSS